MRTILLDADAVLCLRGIGLLSAVCAGHSTDAPLVMTEYVARRELRDIDSEIRAYETAGRLVVQSVEARSETGRRWKRLLSEGVHKGEAEALAWALDFKPPQRPVFVSRDDGARRAARERGVPESDPFGLVIALVDAGRLDRAEARTALSVWSDRRQMQGRPGDWVTFDANYAKHAPHVLLAFDAA